MRWRTGAAATVITPGLFDRVQAPDPPLRVMTLASSSSGNCVFVQAGSTCILVDAGISLARIRRGLATIGVRAEQIDAVVITHAHGDHTAGLGPLIGVARPRIYASVATCRILEEQLVDNRHLRLEPIGMRRPTVVGSMDLLAVPTPHDIAGSLAVLIHAGGRRVAVATDLGKATPDVGRIVAAADVLILEANHCEEMLRLGPYPPFAQERIRGDRGHLSNDAAAELLVQHASRRLRHVLCAHLSRDNNSPDRAREVLEAAIAQVPRLSACRIAVAPSKEPSELLIV